MNVAQVLEASALAYPDHPGIIHGERTLTYAEWWDRARRVAAVLADLGARPGDRVALLLPTRPNSSSRSTAPSLQDALSSRSTAPPPQGVQLHPRAERQPRPHLP